MSNSFARDFTSQLRNNQGVINNSFESVWSRFKEIVLMERSLFDSFHFELAEKEFGIDLKGEPVMRPVVSLYGHFAKRYYKDDPNFFVASFWFKSLDVVESTDMFCESAVHPEEREIFIETVENHNCFQKIVALKEELLLIDFALKMEW